LTAPTGGTSGGIIGVSTGTGVAPIQGDVLHLAARAGVRLLFEYDPYGRPVRLLGAWLPGTPETQQTFRRDGPGMARRLARTLPTGYFLIFGELRNGELWHPDSSQVSQPLETLANYLTTHLPPRMPGGAPVPTPVLAMPGGGLIAHRLAALIGRDVLAYPGELPSLVSRDASRLTARAESGPGDHAALGRIRHYGPDDEDGEPLPSDLAKRLAVAIEGEPVGTEAYPLSDDIELILSAGTPKVDLPFAADLVSALRKYARDHGLHVPEDVWSRLPQQLLANSRHLFTGFVVTLGNAEAMITFQPADAVVVRNPGAVVEQGRWASMTHADDTTSIDSDSGSTLTGDHSDSIDDIQPTDDNQPTDQRTDRESTDTSKLADDGDSTGDNLAQIADSMRWFGEPLTADERAFRATETLDGVYALGAHVTTHTGMTGATRWTLPISFGFGPGTGHLDAIRVGGQLAGVANQHSRSSTRTLDAEEGRVQKFEGRNVLMSVAADKVRFRFRVDRTVRWDQVRGQSVTAWHKRPDAMLLWMPEHYLKASERPERPTPTPAQPPTGLPALHHSTGMTELPRLFDEVLARLQEQGLKMEIGSTERVELRQQIWNLETKLHRAVNTSRGYAFALHNKRGRVVASIRVHTSLPAVADRKHVPRSGVTSDKALLEDVRTAIDGTGGTHYVNQKASLEGVFEADVLPNPINHPEQGLGLIVSGGLTSTTVNGIRGDRTGLWVQVARFNGPTNGYLMPLTHRVVVAVLGRKHPAPDVVVNSRALIRLAETDASDGGFAVDVKDSEPTPEAPVEPTSQPPTQPERGTTDWLAADETNDASVNSAVLTADTESPALVPRHVLRGKGIGMGLAQVDQSTVDRTMDYLLTELGARGFVPSGTDAAALRRHRWWHHGSGLDSKIDNLNLLDRMISMPGLNAFYDAIRQDGLQLTLFRRRGMVGIDLDVDAAVITVKAVQTPGAPPTSTGQTRHNTAVNLSMSLDTAGHSAGGSKAVGFTFKPKALGPVLRTGMMGLGVQRTQGANDAVNMIVNRPELIEYSGPLLTIDEVSDYHVTVEFQHSGLLGLRRRGHRDPAALHLTGQHAVLQVPNLGTEDGPTSAAATPRKVLDQAVIYYFDSSGAVDAVTRLLPSLATPNGAANDEIRTFAGNVELRAHLKEILQSSYTTDQFFKPNLWRDTHGAVDISGQMGPSTFRGASSDPFVIGAIKLWLAESSTSTTTTNGLTWEQADIGAGTAAGAATIIGETDNKRTWQHSETQSRGRVGGTELLQTNTNHAYLYETDVNLKVSARLEKHGKLVPSHQEPLRPVSVPDRRMLYLLPEPEALALYGTGDLPVSDSALRDAIDRWSTNDLKLHGDVVARTLTRWHRESPGTAVDFRHNMADLLWRADEAGALTIMSPEARDAFAATFPLDDEPEQPDNTPTEHGNPFREIELPEHLTRRRFLGHHGVQEITYRSGRSLYEIIKERVDLASPGLLTAGADVWDAKGRVIGRLQGGIDSLQTLFAPGRDHALWEELLSPNGLTLYLVNPMGWLLADIVEINVTAELTTDPVVYDYKAKTGVETYIHNYVGRSSAKSRHGTQTFTIAKINPAGMGVAGVADLQVNEGHTSTATQTELNVTERTASGSADTYLARFTHQTRVRVNRLDMAGRWLTNILTNGFSALHTSPAVDDVEETGTLSIQVNRADAEAGQLRGPHPVRHLVALNSMVPQDAFVGGVLLDDALPAARHLMARVLSRHDGRGPYTPIGMRRYRWKWLNFGHSTRRHTELSLPTLLSRSHLKNILPEASVKNGTVVGENLFIPGHSNRRVKLEMHGGLYDLTVVGRVARDSGTGRYSKFQNGTTVTTGTDHWRATFDAQAGYTAQLASLSDDHHNLTMSVAAPQNFTTAAGDSSASTAIDRPEAVGKNEGPQLIVRLRGRYRLRATMSRTPLFRWVNTNIFRRRVAPQQSRPFTGDVYLKISEGELAVLREQLAVASDTTDVGRPEFADIEQAPTLDLADLLAAAAEKSTGTFAPYDIVAKEVAARVPEEGPLIFSVHPETWATRRYGLVYKWARAHLPDRGGSDRSAAMPSPADREQTLLQNFHDLSRALAARADRPEWHADVSKVLTEVASAKQTLDDAQEAAGDPTGHGPAQDRLLPGNTVAVRVEAATDSLIRLVQDVYGRGHNGALPNLPDAEALFNADRTTLVRDVAHELDRDARLDSGARSQWFDRAGRVYAFDPARFDDRRLTLRQAVLGGLIEPDQAEPGEPGRPTLFDQLNELDQFGELDKVGQPGPFKALGYFKQLDKVESIRLTAADLAHIYRTSWARGLTFEQALRKEITQRRRRMMRLFESYLGSEGVGRIVGSSAFPAVDDVQVPAPPTEFVAAYRNDPDRRSRLDRLFVKLDALFGHPKPLEQVDEFGLYNLAETLGAGEPEVPEADVDAAMIKATLTALIDGRHHRGQLRRHVAGVRSHMSDETKLRWINWWYQAASRNEPIRRSLLAAATEVANC
jgi:hypothetical protein